MFLRNVSIARRAGVGFALISLLVALLGWFALLQMSAIRQSEVTVESRWMPSMRLVNDIRDSLLRTRTISLRMALDLDPAQMSEYHRQMDVRNQDLAKRLETFAGFPNTPQEQQLTDRFRASLANYQQLIVQAFDLAQHGDSKALTRLLLVDMKQVVDEFGKQINELCDFYARKIDEEGVRAQVQYTRSHSVVLIVVIAAALSTIAMAWLLTRSITGPLREAVIAAEYVAAGDLTQTIGIVGKDEVTRLFQALEQMQSNLRGTLRHPAAPCGRSAVRPRNWPRRPLS